MSYIYAGRVVAGLGIGAISAVAPTYVSECSPKEVRGRITGMFQVLVAMGVMVSYFINCEAFFTQTLFFNPTFILPRWCQQAHPRGAESLEDSIWLPVSTCWHHVFWSSIRHRIPSLAGTSGTSRRGPAQLGQITPEKCS